MSLLLAIETTTKNCSVAVFKKNKLLAFNEQNSAGLQNCSQEDFEELHSLNASYNEKFKFPFIIAVTGLNVTKILEQFRIRISNNYLVELNEAIFQVHKIAEIRIKQKINLTEK